MTAVYVVVARAVAVAEGRERGPAVVRLRAGSGRWLSNQEIAAELFLSRTLSGTT